MKPGENASGRFQCLVTSGSNVCAKYRRYLAMALRFHMTTSSNISRRRLERGLTSNRLGAAARVREPAPVGRFPLSWIAVGSARSAVSRGQTTDLFFHRTVTHSIKTRKLLFTCCFVRVLRFLTLCFRQTACLAPFFGVRNVAPTLRVGIATRSVASTLRGKAQIHSALEGNTSSYQPTC